MNEREASRSLMWTYFLFIRTSQTCEVLESVELQINSLVWSQEKYANLTLESDLLKYIKIDNFLFFF